LKLKQVAIIAIIVGFNIIIAFSTSWLSSAKTDIANMRRPFMILSTKLYVPYTKALLFTSLPIVSEIIEVPVFKSSAWPNP